MRGDFDEDADADEMLAYAQAQLSDIPDWTIEAWQREQLQQELAIMAANKRRPTKRAPRTKTRNPQDATLRNSRAATRRVVGVEAAVARHADLLVILEKAVAQSEQRLAKLEEVIAARVVGKP